MIPIDKLCKVLHLFLCRDCNVPSKEIASLDILVTFVTEQIDKGNKLISEIIENWLKDGLNLWAAENYKPCQHIINFTIKLIANISKEELTFSRCDQQYNIYENVCLVFEHDQKDGSDSQKEEFVKLFLSLLRHNKGQQWLEEKGIWKVILKYAQECESASVRYYSKAFLEDFLLKVNQNKQLCINVIDGMIEPIMSIEIQGILDSNSLEKILSDKKNKLFNAIDLVTSFLEQTNFTHLEHETPEILADAMDFKKRIEEFLDASLATQYYETLQKLNLLLIFAKLRRDIKTIDSTLDEVTFDEFVSEIRKPQYLKLHSKDYVCYFSLCCKSLLIYWHKIQKLKAFKVPRIYTFENQLLRILMQPYFGALNPYYLQNLSFFQNYMKQMSLTTSPRVERGNHALRSIIINDPDIPIEQICVKITNDVIDIADLLTRDALITVCQTIRIVLESYIVSENNLHQDASAPNKIKKLFYKSLLDGDSILERQILLAALLKCLYLIITKFEIKWQEFAEKCWIGKVTAQILTRNNLNPDVLLLCLKFSNYECERYLEPRLALYDNDGCYFKMIGPILQKSLRNENVELHCGALEILHDMAVASEQIYTLYQKFILENKFLEVAFEMLHKNRGVKETVLAVLSFLSASVKIDSLWANALSEFNLLDGVLPLIRDSKEAEVRSSSINLITDLFTHDRSLSRLKLKEMTEIILYASVFDFDSRVKKSCLKFWAKWINYELYLEGMICGKFPDFTFSKKRRIIQLTEDEIISRLSDALDTLAEQGCLGVLLMTLEVENNIEIVELATKIMSDLREILIRYGIIMDDEQVVVDEMATAVDTETLLETYAKNFTKGYNFSKEMRKENLKSLTALKTQEFLCKITNFDFSGCIERKKMLASIKGFELALDNVTFSLQYCK